MIVPAITLGTQSVFGQENEALALEEIVVTATKRPTSEMDTPLSIEAITGDALEAGGLADMQDYSAMVPNVNIGDGQITGSINIRGMGSGTDRSFEQSVAMFIDGIYMPRSRQYRAPFFDVDRVEVMRGPQAVLHGLNATAGTISVTSASTQPGDEFHASITGEYETEYDGYRTSFVTGGSLSDDLAARLAVRYSDNGDGFYENTTTGKDEGATEESIVRATLVWDATDELKVTTKINWADVELEGGTGESFAHESTLLGSDGKLDWKRQTGGLVALSLLPGDGEQGFDQDLLSIGIKVDYTLGNHELTAVVGYSESSFESLFDVSVIGVPFYTAYYEEDFEQYNAEFRIASDPDATLSYIAGIYYGKQDNYNDIPVVITLGGSGYVEHGGNTSETETISPFASLTYQISDSLRVIAGGRYSHEEKNSTRLGGGCDITAYDAATDSYSAPLLSLPTCFGNFFGEQDEITAENFMPELIVQWDVNEDATAYAKVGKSVKSGGHAFSTSVPSAEDLIYDDEKAKTLEVGYKSMMINGRLQLNAAAFVTEYTDLQVNAFVDSDGDGVADPTITNAGESRAEGVELEVNYAATEWLTLGTSMAWLEHQFEEHDSGPCGAGATSDGVEPGSCKLTGENTPFSPNFSAAVSADVNYPLNDNLILTGGFNVAYSDEYFTEGTLTEAVEQSYYTRVDARIGVASADDKWSVSLIGKNLESTPILASGQSFPFGPMGFGMGYIGQPKTITLQGKYNF